jgi:hypothetical protein
MGGTNVEWKQLAVQVVAQGQPCKPNDLIKALEGYGASVRAANETLLTMIRDGQLKRTWNGKLVLP